MSTTQSIDKVLSKVNVWIRRVEESKRAIEHCLNPWNPSCGSTDIELYILYEDMKIPICQSCWQKIAETDLEW